MQPLGNDNLQDLNQKLSLELMQLKQRLSFLEKQDAIKDHRISLLTSRIREYEMGEYGLMQAIGEMNKYKNIIKSKEKHIEALTQDLNFAKFEISKLLEKKNEFESPYPPKSPIYSSKEELIDEEKDLDKISYEKVKTSHRYPVETENLLQYKSKCNYLDTFHVCIQNAKLRTELQQVCEKAMEMQILYQEFSENFDRNVPCEVQNFTKSTELRKHHSNGQEVYCINFNQEEFYKFALGVTEKEDSGIQEMFHELMHQIKILKDNQDILVRRYLILYDYYFDLHKENNRLKKENISYKDKEMLTHSSKASVEHISPRRRRCVVSDMLLHDFASQKEASTCKRHSCKIKEEKLHNFEKTIRCLYDKNNFLKQLLDIANHQTHAFETLCASQEAEISSLLKEILLIQAENDGNMMLGKLAKRLLHFQHHRKMKQ